MKINPINVQTGFTRAIRVTASGYGNIGRAPEAAGQRKALKELQDVLNRENDGRYSELAAQNMEDFFIKHVEDYRPKEDNILIRTYDKDTILFSGEEAKEIKRLEERGAQTREQVRNSHNIRLKKRKEIIRSSYDKVAEAAYKMLENGKAKKPNSVLKFTFKKDKKAIDGGVPTIKNIAYKFERSNKHGAECVIDSINVNDPNRYSFDATGSAQRAREERFQEEILGLVSLEPNEEILAVMGDDANKIDVVC